jgi:hypothetical protein
MNHRHVALTIALMAWLMLSVLTVGCSSVQSSLGLESEPPPPPSPQYYDFPDVLIPSELKLDRKDSVVYEFKNIKAGLLRFTGRVEVSSLVDFFSTYLPRDGWTLVSSLKYRKTMLNFAKPNKTCQVFIRETIWSTEVEVWLHPYKIGS